jgi:hypothetical protein
VAPQRAALGLGRGGAEAPALAEEFLAAAAEEGMRAHWILGVALMYASMLVLVLEKLEALWAVVEALTHCRPQRVLRRLRLTVVL